MGMKTNMGCYTIKSWGKIFYFLKMAHSNWDVPLKNFPIMLSHYGA
jgi:hypothetical protein